MRACDESLVMVESARADGRLHLVLSGSLDIASAPRLESRLRQLETGCLPTELDLERVTFIDLVGLAAIHIALIHSRRGPWAFDVRHETGRCVSRLVGLTGIDLWPGAAAPVLARLTIPPIGSSDSVSAVSAPGSGGVRSGAKGQLTRARTSTARRIRPGSPGSGPGSGPARR